ncbi:hypothetical protein ADIS_2995 [Lunatimonas lonarensis]|uniref:Uncharacterized protein n=1 Tax=Lunatimonas lonarensis TaxID=1232681 RepID=R7ZR04_9BACT|nr:hypothetical protein ADIS_2995 [Lunatimonas lonarensis]
MIPFKTKNPRSQVDRGFFCFLINYFLQCKTIKGPGSALLSQS